MQKFFIIIFILSAVKAFAKLLSDEAFVEMAKQRGTYVYYTCILTPPISSDQEALCFTLYTRYVDSLKLLNSAYPLVVSTDPSPYTISPYDVCKYETGHIVFGNKLVKPYCPSLVM